MREQPCDAKDALARRVCEVRRELFGDDGIPALAEALGVPYLVWEAYEHGAVMPATVLLWFIELTEVNPRWLLTGEGERYSRRSRQGKDRPFLAE